MNSATPAMGRGFEPGDEPETPEETERLDRALEDMTWESRQQVEAAVAMGNYGTPMDDEAEEVLVGDGVSDDTAAAQAVINDRMGTQ